MQRAAGAAPSVRRSEVRAVVEDARRLAVVLDDHGLALAVLVDVDPVVLLDLLPLALLVLGPELPERLVEHADVVGNALLVVLVGEVGAERATAHVRGVLVDALAALAEDALVAGGEPGQVAAHHLRVVVGVGELDVGARKDQVDLGHLASVVASRWRVAAEYV